MAHKLYVGGLNYQTSNETLHSFFATAGRVVEATVINDRHTGQSKGFGFVEMSTADEAKKAISEFDGKQLDGRSIKVNAAREKTERPRHADNRW